MNKRCDHLIKYQYYTDEKQFVKYITERIFIYRHQTRLERRSK